MLNRKLPQINPAFNCDYRMPA